MNILFIIGNGFDINLEMETQYSEFYKYYNSIDSQDPSINILKDSIKNHIKDWADLESRFGKHTANLDSVDEFDKVFADIREKLGNYLIMQENKFDFNSVDRQKFLTNLAFPEKFLENSDRIEVETYKSNWKSYQWLTNIITLNYTKTIEKILGQKNKNIKIGIHDRQDIILQEIKHVHGYVDSKMIIGVNDVSQISNTNFKKEKNIINALVKDACNSAHKHNIEKQCKKLVSSANLICIFGSSIGVTDNLWWELIGNQLKRNCKLIIFDICDSIKPSQDFLLPRIRDEKKMMFLDRTTLSKDEKNIIEKNVYIALNTDMFKILEKPVSTVMNEESVLIS